MSVRPRWLRFGYSLANVFADPRRVLAGAAGLGWFVRDWIRYRRLPGAESLTLLDAMPAVHERRSLHELDAHYFYTNAWAARALAVLPPGEHVDVASQLAFSSIVSAVRPCVYVDYRPLVTKLTGLRSVGGSLLALPFADGSLSSVSCLHVVEHIGLGRYGDPLAPSGTRDAMAELSRVVAPGGSLLVSTPVGRERVCFNAHRVHRASTILRFAVGLQLHAFAVVGDDGRFHPTSDPEAWDGAEYACGLFHFVRPSAA